MSFRESTLCTAGSAIVSSPAFAYDTPVLATNGSIVVSSVTRRRIDVQQTGLGTATCPGSASSAGATIAFVRWELGVDTLSPGTSTVQVRMFGGGGSVTNLPTTYLHRPGAAT